MPTICSKRAWRRRNAVCGIHSIAQRHRLAVALQARHAVEHELGAAQGGAAQNFRRGIDASVARSARNRLQRIRNAGAIRRGLQERLGPLAKILVAR